MKRGKKGRKMRPFYCSINAERGKKNKKIGVIVVLISHTTKTLKWYKLES